MVARIVANALAMEACDTRSSSTIMPSPPCSVMAFSSAAALAARRVVSTTKKPSLANFWAMAPPTPQRTPTGRSLSSSTFPCASWVLRPSACHLEVAPTTTATCLRVESIADSLSLDVDCSPWPQGNTATYTSSPPAPWRGGGTVAPSSGASAHVSAGGGHGLMRPEEVTHVAYRQGDQVLRFFPG